MKIINKTRITEAVLKKIKIISVIINKKNKTIIIVCNKTIKTHQLTDLRQKASKIKTKTKKNKVLF
jgi:hypothetical protein